MGKYKRAIIEIVGKMHDESVLEKIYNFVLDLYIREE